jgi:hypothetical protein
MIVASTSRIELGAASRATKLALQVLVDRQLYPTSAAKYCFLAPFALWPDFDFVFAQRSVAFLARIVDATALHLDRNDVGGSVKVFAPGLRIEIDATHLWKVRSHGTKKKQRPSANGQQFLVESANLPDAIHEVDLEYPMLLSARSIWHPHSAVIFGIDVKTNFVPCDFLMGEDANQMSCDGTAVLPARFAPPIVAQTRTIPPQ